MDLNDNSKAKQQIKLYQSFRCALQGITGPILKERNFKIQLAFGLCAILLSAYFQIQRIEWIIIILCVGLVLALELINFAIERTVDLAADYHYHELAKWAKDASAGAVLLASIVTVIIGVLIFYPYLLN